MFLMNMAFRNIHDHARPHFMHSTMIASFAVLGRPPKYLRTWRNRDTGGWVGFTGRGQSPASDVQLLRYQQRQAQTN
jgi:hypothetical protein